MITLREAKFPGDVEPIKRLDTSFTTDVIFKVCHDNDQMSLRLTELDRPVTKQLRSVETDHDV